MGPKLTFEVIPITRPQGENNMEERMPVQPGNWCISLLLAFSWLKLSHMATSNCRGDQEMFVHLERGGGDVSFSEQLAASATLRKHLGYLELFAIANYKWMRNLVITLYSYLQLFYYS